ncbi:MAG: signal peptidase II [Bacteroidales bacterium]
MNKYLKGIGVFAGGWIVAMLFFALLGNFDNLNIFLIDTFIPAVFLGIIGFILSLFQKEIRPSKKSFPILPLIILVIIDQGLKQYLFTLDWSSIYITIIKPSFYFQPVQNTHGSYLASLLNLNIPKFLYFILYIIVGFVVIKGYRFYTLNRGKSIWSKSFIILFVSGIICVAIDNGFRGGTLDYILINPLYTFDIKDIYLTMSVLCFIIELWNENLLFNHKMSKEEEKKLMKDFRKFLFKE